jgi:hypothetical protein
MTTTLSGPTGRAFLLAGKAIFTISNPSGERYTFMVQRVEPKPGSPYPATYFGKVLTGRDNTSDYTYLGIVLDREGVLTLKATAKSQVAKPFKVLEFVLRVLSGQRDLPEGYVLQHEGRCGRCGRTLTVPSSIESGIGPECATKL